MTEETTPSTNPNPPPILRKDIKCVVIGDNNIGKTTLLIRYTTDILCPPTELPSVFDNYSIQIGSNVISLFDTNNPEEARQRLLPLIYSNTDILIICFSVARLSSFENVKGQWLHGLESWCPGTPWILVGLQSDLRDEPGLGMLEQGYGVKYPLSRGFVSKEEGREAARRWGASGYVECSSVMGVGVRGVFEEAVLASQRSVPMKMKKRGYCVVA
ncbi:P-loop containing nucleoside triphosphate hydrolase protein [Aspergillus spectabilis]